jgi:glycogen debranching enzyme
MNPEVLPGLVLKEEAKQAALEVLLYNTKGPYRGLPRTAGWGYPEPYTRDLMIATLGILITGHKDLMVSLRRVFEALAHCQSSLGQIPSLANDPEDLGSSDTTPLFLIGLALFRKATGEHNFLNDAAQRALTWMQYQSSDETGLVLQQPTSDWRDEQWVPGYGLYANTLVYTYLRLWEREDEALALKKQINKPAIRHKRAGKIVHEGLAIPGKPYYALWAYKIHKDERFDLLGNSLAILSGIAKPTKASAIINWVESQCRALRARGDLVLNLPPCLFPYIQPGDYDWRQRYEMLNRPGEYHNGGIWPFVCGFYIAALVAAGKQRLAEEKLAALIELVRPARSTKAAYGFNEWFRAQDGKPCGQDWQTWSAAMVLYAAAAVEQKRTPFFEELRVSSESG